MNQFAIALAVLSLLISLGNKSVPEMHDFYSARGCYESGFIITDDGNKWGYYLEDANDGDIVYPIFDDAGTPNDFCDDEIISVFSV